MLYVKHKNNNEICWFLSTCCSLNTNMKIKYNWRENSKQSNLWIMVRKRGSPPQIKTDGGDELRRNLSVSEITMVTTHSILSTSWVGATASNKWRERQTLTFRLQTLVFLPWKNRPPSESNDCSCKPATHQPQHVCEEHMFTCVHGERPVCSTGQTKENYRRSSRTRSDKILPSNWDIQPASITIKKSKKKK